MQKGCINDCLRCGKCAGRQFSVLDTFNVGGIGHEPRSGFGVAADIGTTSAVLSLVNLSSGKITERHSFMNPQRAFGTDVISRINAANNGELEPMRRAITDAVSAGVQLISNHIAPESAVEMVVSANTTMTYLLLGLSCDSLGVSPFKPAHSLKSSYDYQSIFGGGDFNCLVRIMPWMSAFVGGDITAGLLSVFNGGTERFMLIDLGTNGEMALYHDGKLTITSTAAGPAFEGGRHQGGASAVVAELARLVREGHIDETGYLSNNDVLFTQQEVRELQLAKSAVRSGIEILLESAGIGYSGVDTVYLAGGIGQAIDVNSAADIGILPQELKSKVRAVGNTSLGGACRMLCAPELSGEIIKKLLNTYEEINLAAHPKFNDYFMEFMIFS
ncbi:MAG: ASKHA domain-containing protein [Oscillospiraceae bacterium]|nr:ASKHA domain-containing protein [Oscillospiraceae bacterium]